MSVFFETAEVENCTVLQFERLNFEKVMHTFIDFVNFYGGIILIP